MRCYYLPILFVDSWLSFLAIVMSVLRFIDSDCPLVCPNSSYEIWFDTMGTEPMVSCTLVECSYLYPHKDDVRFTFTPSCFVKRGGSFLSMLLVFIYIDCRQHDFHITWCLSPVTVTQQMPQGLLTFMGHMSPSLVSCGLFSRPLLDLFDIVVYDLLYTW